MSALREVFARFGIEVDDKQLKSGESAVASFTEKLKQTANLLAGGFVGKAIWDFAKRTADIGDAINDNATRLGISTQSYQQLGYAAQMSASNAQELTTALLMLQDKAVDAARGGEESAKSFARLGVTVKDAHGNIKPVDGLLLDVADKIAAMKDPAKQTASAVDAFGRQGRALLPFLKEGREGISKLSAEAVKLGGGFDAAAVQISADFNDSVDRAGFVVTSLRGRIATALLPALRYLVEGFVNIAAWIATVTKNSMFFEAAVGVLSGALVALGARALVALWPIVAPVIKAGALFLLLALIVDDLIVLFKGGKSVIGEAIDAMLGVGTAVKMVEALKDAWAFVVDAVKESTQWLSDFLRKVDEALAMTARLAGRGTAATRGGTSEEENRKQQRVAAYMAGRGGIRFKGETGAEADAANLAAQSEAAQQIVEQRSMQTEKAAASTTNASASYVVNVNAASADAIEVATIIDTKMRTLNQEAHDALTRNKPR